MREIKSKSLLKKERDPKRKAWTIMSTANSGKKQSDCCYKKFTNFGCLIKTTPAIKYLTVIMALKFYYYFTSFLLLELLWWKIFNNATCCFNYENLLEHFFNAEKHTHTYIYTFAHAFDTFLLKKYWKYLTFLI